VNKLVRRSATLDYSRLPTERPHPRAAELDHLSTGELVDLLLTEEANAVAAVARARAAVTRGALVVADVLARGGRLIYAGAGTSGRLGVLDAAELPPTFGSDPQKVIALLAGGARAVTHAVEGAEDRPADGARAVEKLRIGASDVLCAIAASGATPFTLGALSAARKRGARTLLITCTPRRRAADRTLADVVIVAHVGPEVIAGSTRLKAGTATKLILNALSTAAMVRLGKVYRGRMVDLVATNEKLRRRAVRIVEELGEVSSAEARALLKSARGKVKIAVAAALLDTTIAQARARLEQVGGNLVALERKKRAT
jgi:N-acetylmuramic acid 6-phosphate etherase